MATRMVSGYIHKRVDLILDSPSDADVKMTHLHRPISVQAPVACYLVALNGDFPSLTLYTVHPIG